MTDTHDRDVALPDDLSYRDALEELDEILAHLESTAVDVDVLAERVERGATLIRFCRQRLRVVRADVDAAIDLLAEPDPAAADGAEPA
jgi:exodeoxyribonuclease VII small subunit